MTLDDNDLLQRGELPKDPRVGARPIVRTTGAAGGPWERPIPLEPEVRPPVFPLDVLSPPLAEFAGKLAAAVGAPIDLAAAAVLGAIAIAIAGKARVKITTGWYLPLNLFIVTVAQSGLGKSPILHAVLAPHRAFELEIRQRTGGAVAKALAERSRVILRVGAINRQLAEGRVRDGEKLKAERDQLVEELTNSPIPAVERLIADNVTPERLATILGEQRGRMAIAGAEGDIVDILGGLYNRGRSNAGNVLRAWGGDVIDVERVNRPRDEVLAPALTLLLGVQPTVLRELMKNGELVERGLAARILFSVPPTPIGPRRRSVQGVPEQVTDEYRAVMNRLLGVAFVGTSSPDADATTLGLATDALQLWEAFRAKVDEDACNPGLSEAVVAWRRKLADQVARLAALLQLVKDTPPDLGTVVVGLDAMQRAISLGEYFCDHATAAFGVRALDSDGMHAGKLLHWLRKVRRKEFSVRDALCALQHAFVKSSVAEAAARRLEEHGFVRGLPPDPAALRSGRPPSPRFEVHPDVCGTGPDAKPAQPAKP